MVYYDKRELSLCVSLGILEFVRLGPKNWNEKVTSRNFDWEFPGVWSISCDDYWFMIGGTQDLPWPIKGCTWDLRRIHSWKFASWKFAETLRLLPVRTALLLALMGTYSKYTCHPTHGFFFALERKIRSEFQDCTPLNEEPCMPSKEHAVLSKNSLYCQKSSKYTPGLKSPFCDAHWHVRAIQKTHLKSERVGRLKDQQNLDKCLFIFCTEMTIHNNCPNCFSGHPYQIWWFLSEY